MAHGQYRRKSSHRGLTIVLSLFCIALIAVGGWLFWQSTAGQSAFSSSNNPFSSLEGLDPSAELGTPSGAPTGERASGDNAFGYRINLTPSFSDGQGKLDIQNPAFNKYLLVVELCLEDDPTVIYRSQYIPPNHYIQSVKLATSLPAGEHRATAYLNVIDPITLELAGILDCPILLTSK